MILHDLIGSHESISLKKLPPEFWREFLGSSVNAHVRRIFAGTAAEYPMGYAIYLLAAMQPFQGGREIVISGKREDLLMQEMIAAVQQSYLPGTAVLIHWDGEEGAKLRGLLPHVREMKPVSGQAAAYICEHFSCKEPVTTLEGLREALVDAM